MLSQNNTYTIGEFLFEYNEKNTDGKVIEVYSVGSKGIRKRSEIYGHDLSENYQNYKIIFEKTLTIGMGSKQIDIGIFQEKNYGLVSPAYTTYKIQNIEPQFLKNWLIQNSSKISKLYMITGARQGKSVNKVGLLSHPIKVPNNHEQVKIGSFFSAIDRLIEKHREKLDRIKSLKKGYLQKMFPTQFELTPQLRFTSFKSNWQEGLISDLLIERIEIESKSNTYPLMSFVSGRGVVPKSDRYNREFLVSDVEGKDYKKTEFGDFIYSSNNLETGSIGLNSHGKATISPVYSIFYPSQKTTSKFIERLLLRKPFIYQMLRFRQGVVYGQWRIHEKHFLKIPILYPTRDEQLLVGSFFDRIDYLISKEEALIERYESLKKSYLQRIFAE
jgi:type I restriction enzyme S subunit